MLTVATVSILESDEVEAKPAKRAIVRTPSSVGYGIAAAFAALLLSVAFSSQVLSTFFSPKYLVLLLIAAIGFVPLVRLARSSSMKWVARAAIGFLAVGLVSALLSHAVNLGFFGLDDWGTGWLFWLGCAGAFALGARLGRDELDWLFAGIIAGAIVNAVVAIFQIVGEPVGTLAPYTSYQADGLFGNPIYLEALLLGSLALVARRACVSGRRMAWWPIILLLSVALEFSSERFALPVLLLIIVVSLLTLGLRRATPFGALAIAGYAIGYLTGGSGLGTRVASGTADTTYANRVQFWDLALRSVVHHPLFGIGPGQVGAVIIPHLNRNVVHGLPVDSHDFLVEVLATTGALGFLAFVAWIGGAGLMARGPFLGCAMALLVVELVEPLNVAITPLALLALGAATVTVAGQPTGLAALRAWRPGAVARESAADCIDLDADTSRTEGRDLTPVTRARRWLHLGVFATTVLTAVALFIGIRMVEGDHFLLESSNSLQPTTKIASAVEANKYLPYWPDAPAAVAQGYMLRSILTPSSSVQPALSWEFLAARRDPADPEVRSNVGTVELELGNLAAARQQFLQSVRLDRWTFDSLAGLGTVAWHEHQWSQSLYWYERAAVVAPQQGELASQILIDEAHLKIP
jgi:O-antigen ligase